MSRSKTMGYHGVFEFHVRRCCCSVLHILHCLSFLSCLFSISLSFLMALRFMSFDLRAGYLGMSPALAYFVEFGRVKLRHGFISALHIHIHIHIY